MKRTARRGLFAAVLIASLLALPQLLYPSRNPLPPIKGPVRLTQGNLVGLPVVLDKVRACGCWAGPHNQAQKKFKFKIRNDSDFDLDIGGGENSNLRLLVAYPADFTPEVSLPTERGAVSVSAAMPANVDLEYSTNSKTYRPTPVVGGGKTFGLAHGWRLFAIPPNPNRVIESMGYGDDTGTYPTYVSRNHLAPGQTFYERGLGIGSWVFYVPIPPGLEAERYPDPPKGVDKDLVVYSEEIPRVLARKYVNLVGIAILDPGNGKMLGFAPVPTDSMNSDPSDF